MAFYKFRSTYVSKVFVAEVWLAFLSIAIHHGISLGLEIFDRDTNRERERVLYRNTLLLRQSKNEEILVKSMLIYYYAYVA